MRGLRRAMGWSGCALLVACEGEPTVTPPRAPLDLYAPHTCADGEAPLRGADGANVCLRVGATPGVSAGDFPSTEGATGPFVYVRAGAMGGDGSIASPYPDVTTAFMSSATAGTILVARGTYALASPVALTRSVEVRGVGADRGGTTFEAQRGGAVTVRAVGTERVRVTLAGLAIRSGTDVAAVGVEAAGASVDVTLRDVVIRGVGIGVRAEGGATLRGERISVEESVRRSGEFAGGSTGVLRDSRFVRGMGDGLWADRARLDLARVLVADHQRDGLVLLGSASDGTTCTEDPSCVALPPPPAAACLSGRLVRVHELVDVSLMRNGVTGMRAQGAEGGGAFVRATRLFVADTRVPAGTVGGDGLFVSEGARACLDPDIRTDARRGLGSGFFRNARAGILADDGSPTPSGRLGTRVDVAGALVGTNRGPGVFVQNGALAERLAFTLVSDNVTIGVGAARGGRLALLLCDQMLYTRAGELSTVGVSVMLGDGLTVVDTDPGAAPTTLTNTELSHNERFGLVVQQATVRTTGARGEGNGFGVGAYGGGRVDGASGVLGRAVAPTIAATFRGALPSR